jgi:hypothetical protein
MAYLVSNELKTAIKQKAIMWKTYFFIDGEGITVSESDFIQTWKLTNGIYDANDGTVLGNATSKMLELQLINTHTLSLENKEITLYSGVVLNPEEDKEYHEVEYVPMGSFIIQPIENKELPAQTKFVAYDYMVKFNVPYSLELTFPLTARQLVEQISDFCGVQVSANAFINEDFVISLGDGFKNHTCREVISSIAKLSGSVAIINRANELEFKTFVTTTAVEEIDKNHYFSFEKNNYWGEINELVINSYDIEGENVVRQDEDSINTNGLTQITIQDPIILYNQDLRSLAIEDIWTNLNGKGYTPIKMSSIGFIYLDPLDYVQVANMEDDIFNTYILNNTITYNYGSIKSIIESPALTKSEVQLKFTNPEKSKISRTEFIVNKHENLITSLVYDMYEENGVLNETFTQMEQTINDITFSVQNSGGSNLIKNSVLYAWEDNLPRFWTVSSGTISYIENDWSRTTSAKRAWNVATGVAFQDISTEIGKEYTISLKALKLDSFGSASVSINNAGTIHNIYQHTMPISNDESYETKFTANANTVRITISVSGTQLYIGDLMFAVGNFKTQWQQANGEIYNSQVLFDENGVTVISNVYEGYTTMNPTEFAGYYELNGVLKKVFTLNKDTTEVAKLKIESPIGESAILDMPPIKVIALPNVGWDFIFID